MINIKNLKLELPRECKTKQRVSARISIETQSDGSMVVETLYKGGNLRVEGVSEGELAYGLLQIVKELSLCTK